jgi:cell division protein ZapB
MEAELARLEQKVAALIAHAQALRAANDALRGELAAAREHNRELGERVQAASTRVDALLQRLPSP